MEVLPLKARTDFGWRSCRPEGLVRAGRRRATAALDEAWRRLVGSTSGMPQEYR
jgi:hypothetical protein